MSGEGGGAPNPDTTIEEAAAVVGDAVAEVNAAETTKELAAALDGIREAMAWLKQAMETQAGKTTEIHSLAAELQAAMNEAKAELAALKNSPTPPPPSAPNPPPISSTPGLMSPPVSTPAPGNEAGPEAQPRRRVRLI